MANQKKGFVMYFDSLGLLNLFPPSQIGELLLAIYDYAQRICEEEEAPEEALFRYPLLEDTTKVGFISMAGHILRDTRAWKHRQAQSRSSAIQRVQRQQAAMKQPAQIIAVREPDWNGPVTEEEIVNHLKDKEMVRWVEQLREVQDLPPEEPEEPEEPPMDPERRRAMLARIQRSLREGTSWKESPMEETPIEEIM